MGGDVVSITGGVGMVVASRLEPCRRRGSEYGKGENGCSIPIGTMSEKRRRVQQGRMSKAGKPCPPIAEKISDSPREEDA